MYFLLAVQQRVLTACKTISGLTNVCKIRIADLFYLVEAGI